MSGGGAGFELGVPAGFGPLGFGFCSGFGDEDGGLGFAMPAESDTEPCQVD